MPQSRDPLSVPATKVGQALIAQTSWVSTSGLVDGMLVQFSNDRHVAQQVANEGAKSVTNRRGFMWGEAGRLEANLIYENNSDPELFVEVDAASLTVLKVSDWNKNNRAGAVVMGADYLVHGSVSIEKQFDDSIVICPDDYDFERWDPDRSKLAGIRNFLTDLGKPSRGTPFLIRYRGNPKVWKK